MRIHFINAGEGNATLIRSPAGRFYLIDTGNPISGLDVIEYLKTHEVDELEAVYITHPHKDHMGGIFALVKSIPVKRIYDNYQDLAKEVAADDLYRWYDEFVRGNPNYGMVRLGHQVSEGEFRLRTISPRTLRTDWNDNSLVFKVDFGLFSCLLMADAAKAVETELIDSGEDLAAQVLQAGHHGADNASSMRFINSVEPSVVIVSTNTENIRGYPSSKTLDRFRKAKAKVYKTYTNGSIVIEATSSGFFSVKHDR